MKIKFVLPSRSDAAQPAVRLTGEGAQDTSGHFGYVECALEPLIAKWRHHMD